ncbi:MAG: ABC transporter permease [Pseudomonadota bacterium]
MNIEKLRSHFPWITLLVLVLCVSVVNTGFLRPDNLLQMLSDVSALFVMAMGITLVIYIGGIDLSSQSVANMTTVLATVILPVSGIWTALVVTGAGAAVGAASGLASTKLKVPSFIATLALGGVALSSAAYISKQQSVSMDGELRQHSLGWIYGVSWAVPNEIFIAAGLLLVFLFLERRTTFGRALKAIGAGELAALASGLRVDRYKIAAYAMSGGLAAAAGVIFAARLAGGGPNVAEGFLLPAIVAVLVGGTPLTGGVGGVLNTLVGTMIVAVIRTGMVYLEVPAQAQQFFFGLMLIVAIGLTMDRSKLSTVK